MAALRYLHSVDCLKRVREKKRRILSISPCSDGAIPEKKSIITIG
ncbi:hypothetical protein TUM4637_02070 [Shewanella hafniensis]|nr:hypothetical protein TUM4637_02070 [Shewanella hafniensis]